MKLLLTIFALALLTSCTDNGYDTDIRDGVAEYDTIPRNDMGIDSSKVIVRR